MVKASCSQESSALVNGAELALPLSRVPAGRWCTVASIRGPGRGELEREGLIPGSTIIVLTRTPLGGPVVVRLGRTRLALSVDVAAQVSTVASTGAGPGR
jgi:Fe2+ transport system protein FeoA